VARTRNCCGWPSSPRQALHTLSSLRNTLLLGRQYNQAEKGSMGSKNGKPVLTEENVEALAQSSELTPAQVLLKSLQYKLCCVKVTIVYSKLSWKCNRWKFINLPGNRV